MAVGIIIQQHLGGVVVKLFAKPPEVPAREPPFCNNSFGSTLATMHGMFGFRLLAGDGIDYFSVYAIKRFFDASAFKASKANWNQVDEHASAGATAAVGTVAVA